MLTTFTTHKLLNKFSIALSILNELNNQTETPIWFFDSFCVYTFFFVKTKTYCIQLKEKLFHIKDTMDTIDSSTSDTIDNESVHKKVKLNGDLDHAKSTETNDSEEEFDFSSSDLEDLDSVNGIADETDNSIEPLSIMAVKSSDDNDGNQLIEAKNDNISVENGDIQTVLDTVVNIGDTSSHSECSNTLRNECDDQVDSIVSTNNNSMADRHSTNEPVLKSDDTADTSALTKCEVDDAYSDEDGAIVNFLGKANEIVGFLVNNLK